MNFKYYIAEGEEAEKVAAEGLRLANESDAQLREVQDSQGPDALLWGSRETMTAFAWKKEGDYKVKPEMKEGFLKPHIEYADDKRFAVYKPDVRTKLGKEIKKQLAACKPFNFSDYVCEHFKVSRWVVGSDSASRTGRSMYRSSCGF